jgi:TPP-dependent indolepyruvate ferredoxin oxidoreductase alpha subunit
VPRAKPTDADHAKMVKLVNDAMATTAAISASSTQHDQKMWQAKLIGIEKAIDGIVYSSYGLTQGEIDIIEAAV